MIAGRGPGLKGRAVLALRLSHRGPRRRGRRDEESTVNHQRRLVLVLGDQLELRHVRVSTEAGLVGNRLLARLPPPM